MSEKLAWAPLLLAPVVVAARVLGAPDAAVFGLAAAALVPLAWTISRATEEAGRYTGPALGGLLNATFANVPELMIALFAVSDGLFDVVRGSLSGSIAGNLLLVLGLSLVVAGRAEIDRAAVRESLVLIGLAVAAFFVFALPNLVSGDEDKAYAGVTFPVAAALLAAYVFVISRAIGRERGDHAGAGRLRSVGRWSLGRAVAVLAVATAGTAVIAEAIIGTIESFADAVHVSDFFAAAVVVAIAGNAAENASAVLLAARGRVKLGIDVALESTAQVAAFVIPALALLSWFLTPLPLAFTPVELGVFVGAAALATLLLFGGRSSRTRGFALLAAYGAVVVAFALKHP